MSALVVGQTVTIGQLCEGAHKGLHFRLPTNGAEYLVTEVRSCGTRTVPLVMAARLKHPTRPCGMAKMVRVDQFFLDDSAVVLRTGTQERVAARKIAKCVEILSNYGKEAQ